MKLRKMGQMVLTLWSLSLVTLPVLAGTESTERVRMKAPILSGGGKAAPATAPSQRPRLKITAPRAMQVKAKQIEQERIRPSQIKFNDYAINGRRNRPRIDFELEQRELPFVETPIQLPIEQRIER